MNELFQRWTAELLRGVLYFVISLAFVLSLAAMWKAAQAQSVGNVGKVGTLMAPDDGAPGAEPQPLGTLDTEADQGLQTESGEFLTVE